MELDIHTSSAGHRQSFDGTDFQCSAEPSHVTTSMSEKLMNEEVDEVTQRSDRGRAPRVDQIVDTNRSRRGAGVHVCNTRLLEIRSTSSNVRRAGTLVPPPSCQGGGPHGWVPVYTTLHPC